MENPKEKQRKDKLHASIQSVSSGSELERRERLHRNEIKKYYNHEGEQDVNYSKQQRY